MKWSKIADFGSEVDRTHNDGKTSRIISLLVFMGSTILDLFYAEEQFGKAYHFRENKLKSGESNRLLKFCIG